MSLNTPYDDQIWDLMVSALAADLSPEEEARFREWLDASPDNREKFEQLSRVWTSMDSGDFSVFEQPDNVAAWNGFLTALNTRRSQRDTASTPPLEPAAPTQESHTNVTQAPPANAVHEPHTHSVHQLHTARRNTRLLAAAAVIGIIAGAGWWMVAGRSHTYETAFGEQKTITLPDGSTVTLQSRTRLTVEPNFNTDHRTVALLGGTARF